VAFAGAAPTGSLDSSDGPALTCPATSTESTANGWGIPFADEKSHVIPGVTGLCEGLDYRSDARCAERRPERCRLFQGLDRNRVRCNHHPPATNRPSFSSSRRGHLGGVAPGPVGSLTPTSAADSEDLATRGVGFKSLTESIDTTTSGGKLIFSIFGALAEFERNLIRERTQVGLAAARAHGRTGGRPSKMTPTKLAQAQQMRENGMHLTDIAEIIGVGRTTLYRHFK
jgi:hypothetical protein